MNSTEQDMDTEFASKEDNENEGIRLAVKSFSDDIGMEFDLDESAMVTFQKRKLKSSRLMVLDVETVLKEIEQVQTY